MGTYYSVSYRHPDENAQVYKYYPTKLGDFDYVKDDIQPIDGYTSWSTVNVSNVNFTNSLKLNGYKSFLHWVVDCKSDLACDSKTNFKVIYFRDVNDAIKFRLMF